MPLLEFHIVTFKRSLTFCAMDLYNFQGLKSDITVAVPRQRVYVLSARCSGFGTDWSQVINLREPLYLALLKAGHFQRTFLSPCTLAEGGNKSRITLRPKGQLEGPPARGPLVASLLADSTQSFLLLKTSHLGQVSGPKLHKPRGS